MRSFCIFVFIFGIALSQNVKGSLESILTPVSPEKRHVVESSRNSDDNIDRANDYSFKKEETPQKSVKYIITANQILDSISEAIKNKYDIDGDLYIYPTTKIKPIEINDVYWTLDILNLPISGVASKMTLFCSINSGKEKEYEFPVSIRCEVYNTVWVSKQRIPRGFVLNKDYFVFKRYDTLRKENLFITDTEFDFSDYEVLQTIPEDSPLSWSSITSKPVVRKGQILDVVASEGMLKVSVKAQALEDGRPGNVIRVRNLNSKKTIQAEIIDENTAKTYF